MKKVKNAAAAVIAGAMLLSAAPALAEGEVGVSVNGEAVQFSGAEPVIVNERTLAPAEDVFGALGAEVTYDENAQSVTIVYGENTVVVAEGVLEVNGEAVETDVEAVVENGSVMVPLRAVAEALGFEVSWDNDARMAVITSEAAIEMIDNTKWQYNESDGVYWQVGIEYCANPADETYETMGIFVPAAYMTASDNGDGTYTCTVNTEGEVKGYSAETAPMVIPVNTPGYSAMSAPTGYVSGAKTYTDEGFIYLNPGCRGRSHGAPAGVTDLKAAIRYVRYCEDLIPGSTDRIFTFGMSGGGAQSALVGSTGDSELYNAYLEAIGAVMSESDAVAGSMCWCPITNLDYANEAYEWNMGSTREGLSEDMQSLSDNMAKAFAEYINELGLTDAEGNVLVLTESEEGIYRAGSYYEYVKGVIENSLNNFLSDTEFPYTPASSRGGMTGGRGGMQGGGRIEDVDGIARTETARTETESGTYETAEEYIASLNKDVQWVNYDSETNTATITSVADFAKVCKSASKSVGAFDDLNCEQGENELFGYGDGNGAHFDAVMANLLVGTEYEDAFKEDLAKTDSVGNTVDVRLNMYNPMYYLSDYYEGYNTSNVAKYWRIRTGINQGDTALTTEMNLALALQSYGADVDFETVWAQAHVEAERTGSSSENFIEWVNECLAE
ncbi:MAG: copper amine oxidase N-terminal domain-containing protein [Clostridia bacterium]|nr:copper amine oxidase N-terminal domain-containing protein [Clostridia bacterium]